MSALEALTQQSNAVTVTPNVRIRGAVSGVQRQIDVLVNSRVVDGVDRRVIVDAKLRRRKIDVTDVEQFEGMMRDCRARSGVLVCSAGYTRGAERRAERAIRLSLVTPEQLDASDFWEWYPCLGGCATARTQRNAGYVLYNQPFGLFMLNAPLTVMFVGKCDACADFHVWCNECGRQFALRGDETEGTCGARRGERSARPRSARCSGDLALIVLIHPSRLFRRSSASRTPYSSRKSDGIAPPVGACSARRMHRR